MASDGGAKRDWLRGNLTRGLVLILFVGLAVLVWVWLRPDPPKVPDYQHLKAFEAYYQAGHPECQPKRLGTIKDPVARTREAEKCASEKADDREKYRDISQSIRATNSSEESLLLAHRQTEIALLQGALSVFLLGVTAWAAWAAADAAKAARASVSHAEADAAEQANRFKQQIKIAKDSVDAARASAVAVDRAWLKLKVKISGPLIFDGDEVGITLTCTCQNIGRSPALGIVWATGVFGTGGSAHEYVRERTRDNYFGGTSFMGRVLFPSERSKHTFDVTMSRAKFIEDCQALANDPDLDWGAARSLPSIIVGVHYVLPGDSRRRLTYGSYFVRQRKEDIDDFDGSEGRFEEAELELVADGMTVPIT